MRTTSLYYAGALKGIFLGILLMNFGACQTTNKTHKPQQSSETGQTNIRKDLSRRPVSRDLDGNIVGGEYTVTIHIGTPPRAFDVVVDSGSSNLAVQGDKSICANCPEGSTGDYDPDQSSSSKKTNKDFSVKYESGTLEATEFSDIVSVEGEQPIPYTFGVITQDASVPNILGLAYKTIAEPDGDPLTPYFDELVSKTGIANEFSMLLCGDRPGSQIIFGGSNAAVSYSIPITEEKWYVVSPNYLRVKGQENSNLGAFKLRTIVDSGTTDLVLAPDMLSNLIAGLQKHANEIGLNTTIELNEVYGISSNVMDGFPTFQIVIDDVNGQAIMLDIAPNTYFKKHNGGYYLRLHKSSGPGEGIILGQVFMENYYIIFDRANKRIKLGSNQGLCS